MGAGKTTAIGAISDGRPVSTEAANLDQCQRPKACTTVGLDCGQTQLPGGEQLRLYGLPGQERFDFMWNILGEGALGTVLLVFEMDARRRDDGLLLLEALLQKIETRELLR